MADWVSKLENSCYFRKEILCVENTYYFNDDQNVIFVDPGCNTQQIFEVLQRFNCEEPKVHILLTHGHYDHIASVKPLCEHFDDVKVYVSENEKEYLFNPYFNLSTDHGNTYDLKGVEDNLHFVTDGEKLTIGKFLFKFIHVPGHTKGGQFIVEESKKVIFSGDSLLRRSVGENTFPGSDHVNLISSLKRVLAELPDDYIVFPGHAQETTVGEEKKHNPYLL